MELAVSLGDDSHPFNRRESVQSEAKLGEVE